MRCLCSALRALPKQHWKDQPNGYLSTKVRKTLYTADVVKHSCERPVIRRLERLLAA